MKKHQARTFLQDPDAVKTVVKLEKGQAYFQPVAEEGELLSLPFASADDMTTVFDMMMARRPLDVSPAPPELTQAGGRDNLLVFPREPIATTPERQTPEATPERRQSWA